MKMDPGEDSHCPGSAHRAGGCSHHTLKGSDSGGISAAALLLGTTVGTSSHSMSAYLPIC